MSFFGFGKSAAIRIEFDDEAALPKRRMEGGDGKEQMMPIFEGREPVRGRVFVDMPKGKKVEHLGVKIELIGVVEMYYDRGAPEEFTRSVIELAAPGLLTDSCEYEFAFTDDKMKAYETYSGINVRCRYYLQATVTRSYSSNITAKRDFVVQVVQPEEDEIAGIKMEVGIEECLHIEFEYNQSRYHLEDVVRGRIFFVLVEIRLKHMQVDIIRRESCAAGGSDVVETETLAKMEVMDGAPVRGESIPVRLFLTGFDLTPTYRKVAHKFSVRYYLNLVLVDEDDRRYFKQQEITLWRRGVK